MKLDFRTLWVLGTLCFGLAAVGCGDDSDGDGGDSSISGGLSNTQSGARARCEMLVSAHCNRVAECGHNIINFFRNAADERKYVEACEESLGESLCSTAVDTASGFSSCLSSLTRASCIVRSSSQSGFQPDIEVPNVCRDVVLMRK